MNKKMKTSLGVALFGVLLSVGFGQREAFARILGRVYGNSLHVENEPRASTAGNFTLGNNDAYIKDNLEVDGAAYLDSTLNIAGQSYVIVPSTETIAAAATITADACGGLKRILASSGDVTTGTTNTFTAPSTSNKGCRMLVVNVSTTHSIYLDANALFPVTTAASIPLGPNGAIEVWSDGTFWRHSSWSEY